MSQTNNKTIFKNTIFLYIRMFLVMIVSMYTVRIVLKTLGVEDYGVYGAIGGLITSLAFVTSVLANSCQRFFAVGLGKKDEGYMNKTFSMMFWIYLIAGIVAICLFETVGRWFLMNKMTIPDERMDAAIWVFHCMIFSFAVSLINAPYQALLIAHERMTLYAYVGIFDVIIKLVIVYLLLAIPIDKLKLYAVLLFCTNLITSSIYVLFCLKNFNESRVKLVWDSFVFKDVCSFSSWTLFGCVSYICNTQGINLLLNVFFGPAANAAYSIGNQVKSLVNQFSSNFYAAVRPPLMKAYSANENEYVNSLFYSSSKFIFVLLFVVIYPLYHSIPFLLKLWLGDVGNDMCDFVRLMLIYAVILSMSDPITTIIQAANKVKSYYLIVDSFTLLSLPLSYVAFKLNFPAASAFIVSIAIFTIAHFLRLQLFRSLTNVSSLQYTRKIIIPILITLLLSLASSYVLSTIFGLFLKGSILNIGLLIINFLISVSSSFYIVLSNEERLKITYMIKNKIPKL